MECVYCSGPLFCPEEVASMTAIARTLEDAGFETFLPHRDGVERLVMGLADSALNVDLFGARDWVDRAIFAVDVFQIVERCEHFVFNMNGRVPDEGGAVEAGIAFAVGKPVVLYKNDHRAPFKGRDNSMLLGLSRRPPVGELRDLPAAIREVSAEQGARLQERPALREPLAAVVRRGAKLRALLEKLPRGRAATEDGELLRAILSTDRRDS